MIDKKDLTGKVLFIDCETSLIELYAHCIGSKQNIGHYQVKKDKKIICISYMVEGDKKPKSLVWDSKQDDKKLLNDFVDIANAHDLIVAQNGDNFDVKVIRGRTFIQQCKPFPPVITLDTLKMSRQNMKLTSHKLDWKSKLIGRGGKLSTDFQLWVDVQNKDKEALKKMVTYCEQDVIELYEVFWKMIPYCAKLPYSLSILVHDNRDGCPHCGSMQKKINRIMKTMTGNKVQFLCKNCGGYWTYHKKINV